MVGVVVVVGVFVVVAVVVVVVVNIVITILVNVVAGAVVVIDLTACSSTSVTTNTRGAHGGPATLNGGIVTTVDTSDRGQTRRRGGGGLSQSGYPPAVFTGAACAHPTPPWDDLASLVAVLWQVFTKLGTKTGRCSSRGLW